MSNETYNAMQLTEQELAAAVLEARKQKYFLLKHKAYWEGQTKRTTTKTTDNDTEEFSQADRH